ncbi:MAG: threonine--tRNA ligase [Candidatus Doudnabacteria bacterium]|nr:threonine--tRNA ligase [bacterium]MDZ4244199.1 threonine--tRNA ligase [Candidatus Doudnabacteria bacterium]
MPKKFEATNLENIRHSLAHLLAAAVLDLWPDTKPAIGPAIGNGFYYDFEFPKPISDADLSKIESRMREILKDWDKFEGKEVDKAEALKFFKDNVYKKELIEEIAGRGEKITLYTSGKFTDLCRGGHVESAKEINPDAFKLTHLAGAYWRGSEKNKMLTRIYGLAFGTKKELDDHLKVLEEAGKRDHRELGKRLDLFSFHSIAPGGVFWHGKGMIIWRELEKFMRQNLDELGYEEVSTPIMVKKEVFETSGHWQHFRKDMFSFDVEGETFVLKPMNCPESTYIFASQTRSYKDLPLRLSEITDRLHRNELSGTLNGLFRVRQLSQDDAHIYCRPDQIEEEIKKLIDLAKKVYGIFDLPLNFKLATRPEKFMGDSKLWDEAEQSLEQVLKNSKLKYEIKPKDGAFYGPKIDVHINDALSRDWQVATIQLDFQMPERFKLEYTDSDGSAKRPVMIHRAIFGAFERFIGILIEHYAGALPLWLSPVQAIILPINDEVNKYVAQISEGVKKAGVRVETDSRNLTIGKKIREATMQKIPYQIIVGEKEVNTKKIAVRTRKGKDLGQIMLDTFLKKIVEEIERKA